MKAKGGKDRSSKAHKVPTVLAELRALGSEKGLAGMARVGIHRGNTFVRVIPWTW